MNRHSTPYQMGQRRNPLIQTCTVSFLMIAMAGCVAPGGGSTHFGSAGRRANVFVTPEHRTANSVAVMPFRAATELIGTSVSDMFVTELLKTQRYQLIERSQLANVLGEAEVALAGLTAGQAARLGQMAGADAVIIGSVSEYENVAQRGHTLPVVGVSVRMIDSTTSRILWSVDHAAQGPRGMTLAQHSRAVVHEMTAALYREIR